MILRVTPEWAAARAREAEENARLTRMVGRMPLAPSTTSSGGPNELTNVEFVELPAGTLRIDHAAAERKRFAQQGAAARWGEKSKRPALTKLHDPYGLSALFRQERLPELVPDWEFHSVRHWRFDYAAPLVMLAIEVEGGIWRKGGGAHSHPLNIERDIEKYNAAVLLGWRVLRYAPEDLGNSVRDVRVLLAGDVGEDW